ncbi:hypothetical protein OGAPHI_004696 [Ogataea philodendri]|uniref:Uncharacterized protein n=1 Tax=Ogataea philodendri TaxID=1378263 RepID=A0A9P8P2H7_9ASCO|nr:uncharacterized protein OGAPHI_004696 [Ogataea philodendri]KAH3663982.1 hypothetical protein OGAPHI_004696 [Ogataea philodendri]
MSLCSLDLACDVVSPKSNWSRSSKIVDEMFRSCFRMALTSLAVMVNPSSARIRLTTTICGRSMPQYSSTVSSRLQWLSMILTLECFKNGNTAMISDATLMHSASKNGSSSGGSPGCETISKSISLYLVGPDPSSLSIERYTSSIR